MAAFLSVVALISLSYVGGSAAMFFGLPTSSYLSKAFDEGQNWASRETPPEILSTGDLTQATVTVDHPEETFDGYTLYTSTHGPEATLVDMRGQLVHQWGDPSGRGFPGPAHARDNPANPSTHWERCHVYPNGDLLVMYAGVNSPCGEGLAKFDKNSRLLWGYSAHVHHDFDVGEDGRIYVLTQKTGVKTPSGLDSIPPDYLADYLVLLSSEGKELETIPLLEAFRASQYFLTFLSEVEIDAASLPPGSMRPHQQGLPSGLPEPGGPFPPPGFMPMARGPNLHTGTFGRGDILHTNSVKVLKESLAPHFPLFKSGQVLLSLRSPSLIAVLDIPSRSVAWAAKGPWKFQHDVSFVDNGHLLLFDNKGSARGSRALEYDPVTQALPWSYTGEGSNKTWTPFRGTSQRLPNGNTLFVNPEGLQVAEVTRDQRIVWQWGSPKPTAPTATSDGTDALSITGATRFGPQDLTFLTGKPGIQPR